MKYTINSIKHFNTFADADAEFEKIKKIKDKMVNINVGADNEEKSFIQLIENDHDEEVRTGSVVLKTLDTKEELILKQLK